MKRVFLFGALLGLAYVARCYIRGQHKPARVKSGLGLRCSDCDSPLADYDEALGIGNGFVPPVRRQWDRENGGEFTRTSSFEPTSRGRH